MVEAIVQCTESAKKAEPGRTPATLRLSMQCKAAGHDCCGYVEDLARLHSVLGPFGVKPCGFSTSHVSRFVELGDGKSDCRLVKAATKRSRAWYDRSEHICVSEVHPKRSDPRPWRTRHGRQAGRRAASGVLGGARAELPRALRLHPALRGVCARGGAPRLLARLPSN